MREMPYDANLRAWQFFDAWADGEMLGVTTPEWLLWWKCWSTAWDDGQESFQVYEA